MYKPPGKKKKNGKSENRSDPFTPCACARARRKIPEMRAIVEAHTLRSLKYLCIQRPIPSVHCFCHGVKKILIMAVNSPEYKTIQRHTNDLRLSVKSDLIELSGVLFAVGLINQGKSDRLRFDAVPEDSRAASLIGFIQDKVKEDPQNYNTFVKALENSNSTHYSNILQKLQRSYNGMIRCLSSKI